MKKINVKEREIKEGWANIIVVGYCDLQYLLKYKDADFYTCGTYGWKADIYKIDRSTVIVTGYSPFGNIRNYDLVKKYEEKARKISLSGDYKNEPKKLERLLQKFVDEILKEEE